MASLMKKKTSKAKPQQGYGLTETNAITITISPNDFAERPSSIGKV
jgi:long-subunit acyl-CoA synthetase (AMP-forming)